MEYVYNFIPVLKTDILITTDMKTQSYGTTRKLQEFEF